MSPIELLKSGIESGNWQDVCDAYHTLTGQSLKPPMQALAAKELASVLRSTLHMAVDRAFDEWTGKPEVAPEPKPKEKSKAKAAKPTIVVPSPAEVEAILDTPDGTEVEVDCEPEDGLEVVDEPEADAITKADITGEGPTEALKTAGVARKANIYGQQVEFVSSQVTDPTEVRRNAALARKAQPNKKPRPQPQKYEVVCSACDKPFESDRPLGSGIGQRCPRCIRQLVKG